MRTMIQALKQHGLDGNNVKLELTESAIVSLSDNAIRNLHGLRSAGVKLSLDDYGIGHSLLSNLIRIPLDEIKIDHVNFMGSPSEENKILL